MAREINASRQTIGGMFASKGIKVSGRDLGTVVDDLLTPYLCGPVTKLHVESVGGNGRIYKEKPLAENVTPMPGVVSDSILKALLVSEYSTAINEVVIQKAVSKKSKALTGKSIVPEVYSVRMISLRELAPNAVDFLAHFPGVPTVDQVESIEKKMGSKVLIKIGDSSVSLDTLVDMFDECADNVYVPLVEMEQIKGINLREYLDKHADEPFEKKLDLAIAVAEAIAVFNNSGAIHRDVKPENIMLEEWENGYKVRLVDTGIATQLGSLPASKHLCGTLSYCTPEHIYAAQKETRDLAKARKGTDVAGVGAVIYEIFEGETPLTYAYEAATYDGKKSDKSLDMLQAINVICALNTEEPIEFLDFQSNNARVCGLRDSDAFLKGVLYRAMRRDINFRYASCDDLVLELKYAAKMYQQEERNVRSGIWELQDNGVIKKAPQESVQECC